ncbi:hypothetical protein B0H16DRAFT_1559447 [Mycena metata]|uniref:Uncharacterized protein n=1 Tax=Mycena metata TaxID=1033252 RepID=A0AAD7IKG3_9AGAR|nr:hypothetical protein B0H16DRAFT_1559447 [Mycena metata]
MWNVPKIGLQLKQVRVSPSCLPLPPFALFALLGPLLPSLMTHFSHLFAFLQLRPAVTLLIYLSFLSSPVFRGALLPHTYIQ